MTQQGTLTAAASAHDDENITTLDHKTEIPLDDEVTIGHGQIPDFDMALPLLPSF
jgi:hypothetical protein